MYAAHLKGTVDRMICDPPFLSDDCQTKSEYLISTYLPVQQQSFPPFSAFLSFCLSLCVCVSLSTSPFPPSPLYYYP